MRGVLHTQMRMTIGEEHGRTKRRDRRERDTSEEELDWRLSLGMRREMSNDELLKVCDIIREFAIPALCAVRCELVAIDRCNTIGGTPTFTHRATGNANSTRPLLMMAALLKEGVNDKDWDPTFVNAHSEMVSPR